MAVYKPPKVLPYQQKLPRMTIPGQPVPAEENMAPFLKRLPPQMQGTDTYQAGTDQSTAGEMKQAYGDYSAGMGQQESALRAQQQAAVAGHQEYMSKLQAAQSQVNTRENDLKLSKNFLIATDPSVDKSVRKFFLSGLSQASGVDPKGDYSKNLQGMVMGMNPESLQALRGAFAKDIRESPPGAIQQQLNGLFSGQIPIENVMARVQAHQAELAAAGAAATDPSRMAQPGTLAGGVMTAAAAPTTEVPTTPAETGGLPVAPEGVGGPAALPTAPVAGQQAAAPVTTTPIEAAPDVQAPPPLDDTGGAAPYVPPPPEAPPTPSAAPAEAAAPDYAAQYAAASTPAPAAVPAPQVVSPTPAAAATTPQAAAPAAPAATPAAPGTTPADAEAAAAAGFGPVPGSAGAGAAAQPSTPTPPIAPTTPARPSLGQKKEGPGGVAGALGMEPSGPFAAQPSREVSPEAAKAAIETVSPEPSTTPREDLQAQVQEYNTAERQKPTPKTPNLQYVEPDKRDIRDRPVAPEIAAVLPHLKPGEKYHNKDIDQLYPGAATDDKDKHKEILKQSKDTNQSAFEAAEAATDLTRLLKVGKEAQTLGGASLSIPTPWGRMTGSITPGEVTRYWENAKKLVLKDTQVSEGQFDSIRDESTRYAKTQLAGSSLSDPEKAVLQTMIEAAFLKNAFAIARANNNGGKQITDKDLQFGKAQGGDPGFGADQNIALLKRNTDNTINTVGRAFGLVVDNPNVGVNWDKLTTNERQKLMKSHSELGNDSPLSPATFKQIAQSEADFQTLQRGGKLEGERFIQRKGDTEEDYRGAQQMQLGTEEGRKAAIARHSEQASEIAKQRFELEQTRFAAQQAHQARQEAQHAKDKADAQAQHRQDQIQKAFQQFAHAMAGAVKGISLPAVNLGGGGEAPVATFQPGQRAQAPRPTQLPTGRQTYQRLIK